MIRFIYADDLASFPTLADGMFRDRAKQFKDRLDWDVKVNAQGWEQDEYDILNPLYLIYVDQNGQHAGSMRTLPTTGRTMINDHFVHLIGNSPIVSPLIWECTRFCLAPDAGSRVAASLLLAGLEMGLRFGVAQALGVFDARMPRIYGRLGHAPDIIGSSGDGHDRVSVGIWNIDEEARAQIAERANIPLCAVSEWFDASFLPVPPQRAAA